MKIYYSAASPYVRKCMIVAHRAGLFDKIEKLPSAASPINRDKTVMAHNALGKVPTLITDDGAALFDSRVICEYLDDLGKGGLFPSERSARWRALTDQALADGILDAALLARYESNLRPESLRWSEWSAGQMDKISTGIAQFESAIASDSSRDDIGTIAFACALGYLDFRFPAYDWRSANPGVAAWYKTFAATPAMQATVPA